MPSRCMLMMVLIILMFLLFPEVAHAEPITILGVTITLSFVLKVLGVVVLIIIIILIFDYFSSFITSLIGSPCGLVKRILAPDVCIGNCDTPGQTCNETASKPYMVFWTQASACTCGVPPAGGGGGSGTSEEPSAEDS